MERQLPDDPGLSLSGPGQERLKVVQGEDTPVP